MQSRDVGQAPAQVFEAVVMEPESLEEAVRAEFEALGPAVAGSAYGTLALALARQLDSRMSWALAKELRETLATIKALHPPKREADTVDDIATQREKRRAAARGAAAQDL